ncbi:comEA protein [Clostridium sp. CAG:230]|nr:MAG: competence protein ComEA [Clostridiaceae bacterium]CDA85656.1 comEA protein [Clostridium sp. CAG:230]
MKNKNTGMIWVLCFLFLVAAIALFLFGPPKKNKETLSFAENTATTKQATTPKETPAPKKDKKDHTTENAVYVSGAVKHPGLYRYYGNKRVDDAITAVGGFCKNASTESINLAQFLQDGEQIVVLTKKQAKKQKSPKEDPAMVNDSKNRQDSQGASKVNINTASVEELMQLPGIGEAKAKMILDYRTQNGAFQKVEDIMKISGIKEGVYNKIKENITV